MKTRVNHLATAAGAALASLVVTLASVPASAQEWKVAAAGTVASGVDGSGRELGIKRARTTVQLGAEAFVDERPQDIFAAALVVELEPRSSFGGSLRYMRMLGEKSGVFIGGEGFVAPYTLFGAGGGFVQHIPISKKAQLTAGPVLNVFFVGEDIPDNQVFWQALLEIGFRADL